MNIPLLILAVVLFGLGFFGLYRAQRLFPKVSPTIAFIGSFALMIAGVFLIFTATLGG